MEACLLVFALEEYRICDQLVIVLSSFLSTYVDSAAQLCRCRNIIALDNSSCHALVDGVLEQYKMASFDQSPHQEQDFQYLEKQNSHENGVMTITHKERRSGSGSDQFSEGTAATAATVSSAYAEAGAPINRAPTAADIKESNSALTWSKIRKTLRDPFSEFMGVFILILFGDGVVAQVVLSRGEKGDYQSISWGWVSAILSS